MPRDDDYYSSDTEYGHWEIASGVNQMWLGRWWHRRIVDDQSQQQLIDALNAKYIYPLYADLVGPPSANDYDEHGYVTVVRRARLMLVGLFEWQGITIARHPAVFGWDEWRSKRWSVQDKGWYVALKPITPTSSPSDFFTPLLRKPVQGLANYLYEKNQSLDAHKGLVPFDLNPYNCHPDNQRVINTRGRPMNCVGCDRRVVAANSRRFRVNRQWCRYCVLCLQRMANWQPIATL